MFSDNMGPSTDPFWQNRRAEAAREHARDLDQPPTPAATVPYGVERIHGNDRHAVLVAKLTDNSVALTIINNWNGESISMTLPRREAEHLEYAVRTASGRMGRETA